ncbi:hypothetical protein KIW84_023920 [Lathyrus oleraceus]|uniref:Uncharacterized protein n=1 Tax=Pisum sativum TaxID=3888 RepID=A0A9D4YE70_PEA|nr:hypothetical protein KIW84_023920 [Pisum sativum]
MLLRRDIPQSDEVHLRESFRLELFHSGWIISSELLTSVTDLSRIFGLDDLKRATTAHPKGQTRRIADQQPHRYSTRLNQQRNMDQVQAELAEMRANMAQFMTMMQGVVQGQEELRALAQRQEDVIPPSNRASPVSVPVHENVAAAAPANDYAVGDELRGIGINGQPLAAETVNARATRAPIRHPAPFVDRQEDMFTLLSEDDDVVRVEERDRKVDALAEKIRAMECQNSLGFDVTNMGLVEGLRIPYKFKAPSFDKYNGTSCPRTHVRAYYRKISAYTDDEKMWMYFFQDSLSGASLDWYMELKRDSIQN